MANVRFAIFASYLSLGLACIPVPAQAATPSAAKACGPVGQSQPRADLILGHFRGGQIIHAADGVPLLVWHEDYACFTSRAQCEHWQKKQLANRHVEGDRTCLPIR